MQFSITQMFSELSERIYLLSTLHALSPAFITSNAQIKEQPTPTRVTYSHNSEKRDKIEMSKMQGALSKI